MNTNNNTKNIELKTGFETVTKTKKKNKNNLEHHKLVFNKNNKRTNIKQLKYKEKINSSQKSYIDLSNKF